MDELSLTPQEFNRKFRGSPVRRAKRRGYLRNVAVALGNLADPSAVPALTQALNQDSESLVRLHAAWALGQIGSAAAYQSLQAASSIETHPDVRAEIKAVLES